MADVTPDPRDALLDERYAELARRRKQRPVVDRLPGVPGPIPGSGIVNTSHTEEPDDAR